MFLERTIWVVCVTTLALPPLFLLKFGGPDSICGGEEKQTRRFSGFSAPTYGTGQINRVFRKSNCNKTNFHATCCYIFQWGSVTLTMTAFSTKKTNQIKTKPACFSLPLAIYSRIFTSLETSDPMLTPFKTWHFSGVFIKSLYYFLPFSPLLSLYWLGHV